jgi:sugar phosphate permease
MVERSSVCNVSFILRVVEVRMWLQTLVYCQNTPHIARQYGWLLHGPQMCGSFAAAWELPHHAATAAAGMFTGPVCGVVGACTQA